MTSDDFEEEDDESDEDGTDGESDDEDGCAVVHLEEVICER